VGGFPFASQIKGGYQIIKSWVKYPKEEKSDFAGCLKAVKLAILKRVYK
jgi:hypothetical protein